MTRKVKLSPLENDILEQLSEAGAEDVTVIMNTVFDVAVTDPTQMRTQFEQAIRRLYSLGLVEFVMSDSAGYPRVSAVQANELMNLGSWITWETNGCYWKRAEGTRNIAIALGERRAH